MNTPMPASQPTTQRTAQRSAGYVAKRSTVIAVILSVICTTYVVIVVNSLIYSARWQFINFHPARTAHKPPTISRAISDVRVGEPFADWMAICAPLLFVGVALLALAGLRELMASGSPSRATLLRISILTGLLILVQGMAAIGMVMLSQFRFPDHHQLHMSGSYLFFFSQAFVVVLGELVSRSYAKLPPEGRLLLPKMAQLRTLYVKIPIVLGVIYLALFVLKGFDLGAFSHPLYIGYVSVEPVLLSAFLFYVLAFVPDCLSVIVAYARGS